MFSLAQTTRSRLQEGKGTRVTGEPLEDLGGAAIIISEEADGDVLRGDEVAANSPRVLNSSLEDTLTASGEGDVRRRLRRRRRSGLAPNLSNSLSGTLDGDPGAEEAIRGAILGDETEKEVLGEHHLAAKRAGLALGEDDGLDGPLGETLENGGDGGPSGPSRETTGADGEWIMMGPQ